MISRNRFAALFVAIAFAAVSHLAKADLVVRSNSAVDTTTGLEWLNLTLSQGYAYDEIANGKGGFLKEGWRFAKGEEVISLASRYVGAMNGLYATPASGLDKAYADAASSTVLKLGMNVAFNDPRAPVNETFIPGLHRISAQGFFDDGDPKDSHVGFAEISAILEDPSGNTGIDSSKLPAGRWALFSNFLDAGTGLSIASSFLVRKVDLAEPASLALFSFGFLFVAVRFRARQHERVQ